MNVTLARQLYEHYQSHISTILPVEILDSLRSCYCIFELMFHSGGEMSMASSKDHRLDPP